MSKTVEFCHYERKPVLVAFLVHALTETREMFNPAWLRSYDSVLMTSCTVIWQFVNHTFILYLLYTTCFLLVACFCMHC